MTAVAKRSELAGLPGTVTTTSLIYDEGLEYDAWASSLDLLGTIGQGVNWWIGDAVNAGEAMYGEKYSGALELLRIADQTALNVAYTCRQVAPNRRREKLSFSHHSEVASLTASMQSRWLKMAEDGDELPGGGRKPWSVKTLRAAIHASRPQDPEPEAAPATSTASRVALVRPVSTADPVPAATTPDRREALELLARVVKKILNAPKDFYAHPQAAYEKLSVAYALLEEGR